MKLVIDRQIEIYLNKLYNIDLNRENIDKFIKEISEKHNLNLEGYLKIKIYKDKNYGIIINIEKEEIEYLDCFTLEIESDIEIIEDEFLYKIEDIYSIPKIENYIMYKNKDEIYLKPKNISVINLGKIIENSKIIYGKQARTIKKQATIIKEVTK